MISDIPDKLRGKMPLGARRSSKWPETRKAFLILQPECQVCGSKVKLQVHHIKSFHQYPELENESSNLITLCESKNYGVNCHLFIGHCGNFRRTNPDVIIDAEYWHKKISIQINPELNGQPQE